MYKFKEQMERELQRIIFLKKRIKPAEENDKRGLMAEGGGGRNVRIYEVEYYKEEGIWHKRKKSFGNGDSIEALKIAEAKYLIKLHKALDNNQRLLEKLLKKYIPYGREDILGEMPSLFGDVILKDRSIELFDDANVAGGDVGNAARSNDNNANVAGGDVSNAARSNDNNANAARSNDSNNNGARRNDANGARINDSNSNAARRKDNGANANQSNNSMPEKPLNAGLYSANVIIADWQKMETNSRPFETRHFAVTGEPVRSKNEALIYNLLYSYGIPFKYECLIKMKGPDGLTVKVSPDFIIRAKDGTPLIYEHFGMMNDSDYRANFAEKIGLYGINGYSLWENLFISSDATKGIIDTATIDRVIQAFILPKVF